MVKAKFRVNSITIRENLHEVELGAVYGKDGSDNAEWSKYTPSGTIKMSITNPEAYNQFEIGREYFITFTEAKEN